MTQITKQIADNLVDKHESFYRKDLRIGCTDVYIYNYILVNYDAFKDDYARELRGLTITKENAQERVFLSVPKFFNLNEIPENNIDVLTNKKIKKVQDKADGSMIQFIEVEGEILAKTKQSFENEQAKLAQEILDSSAELKYFILDCLGNNFHPLFELVGPSNRHVLEYPEDELVLIAVRNQEGEFIDVDKFNYKYTIKCFDENVYTLSEMTRLQETQKDTEGFIVKFTDGHVIKIKTLDYMSKHRLYDASDSYKEVFKRILNEELDDILMIVHESKKEKLLEQETLLVNYVNHWVQFIFDEVGENSKGSKKERKELALEFNTHRHFGVIMKSINKDIKDIKEILVNVMITKYNKEQKAQEFFKFLEHN